MTDAQAHAHVWTLCLAALVLCALTGPIAAVLVPLVHDSSPALPILAAALAVLLIGAVLRVLRPRLDGHR